jgi:hypothetical protein
MLAAQLVEPEHYNTEAHIAAPAELEQRSIEAEGRIVTGMVRLVPANSKEA